MSSLVTPLLVVHVLLALSLLVPAVLLPFALRSGGGPFTAPRGVMRGLLTVQSRGAAPIGLGVAVSGLGLVWALGLELLGQPWLLVALALYAVDIVVALAIQRRGLRRLAAASGSGADGSVADGSPGGAAAIARRLRWGSYGMAGVVGLIGYLMSTKPDLW